MSLRQFTNVAAPDGAPQFSARIFGFTKRGLVNLHRLADAAPATAYLDDVTGTSGAPIIEQTGGFGSPTATALSGGGLRIANREGLPFKSPINNALPWTIAFGLNINPNSTLMPQGRALYFLGGSNGNGIAVYHNVVAASLTTSVQLPGFTAREFETGGTLLGSTPAVSGLNYGSGFVMFVKHLGSGAGALEVYRLGVLVASVSYTMALTTERGSTGTDTMTYVIGGGTNYDALDINVEALAQWSVALSANEEVQNYNAFAALANGRGRTWV